MITLNVLDNDTGNGKGLVEVNPFSQQGGAVSISNNQIIYTPKAGFSGTDIFWYVMEDDQGRTNSAKVTVSVTSSGGGKALEGGDLAVVGVNANNFACSSLNGQDLISIVCFKDITNDVKALTSPYGKYQIANVRAKKGGLESHDGGNTGTSGGWQIVFVYESATLPAKNISLFDGYANITEEDGSVEVDFDGFQTIPNGNVNADIVIGALEGDRDLSGDKLQIKNTSNNWVDLSYSLRDANNFFNSSITTNNLVNTARKPENLNTLGFDIAELEIPNNNNEIIISDINQSFICYLTRRMFSNKIND